MARNEITSQLIDDVIRYGTFTVAASATIAVPSLYSALGTPLSRLYAHLDEKDKERAVAKETRRIISYMKSLGYLTGDYEHGLQLTERAKRRLKKRELDSLAAKSQTSWDKIWRIVIYDIPEDKSGARRELQRRLREYGCFELQRSVLITPFPCFEDVATLSNHLGVTQFVTYFESQNLANDSALIKRFEAKYPYTSFK